MTERCAVRPSRTAMRLRRPVSPSQARGGLDDPRGSPALAFDVIVVADGLLHGAVLGLLHRPNQRNAAPGRLGQVARAQPVRTELRSPPAVERTPVGETALHGGGRMRTRHAQQILGLKRCMATSAGMPCSGSLSRWAGSQR